MIVTETPSWVTLPKIGLFDELDETGCIELSSSIMVGDTDADSGFARAVG